MKVREAMAARVASGQLPGLVMLVEQQGKTEVDVMGKMAFGDSAPMRRDSIFRLASLTKPITAAAVMMLADDGVLSLEEPVDRFLPELADRRVLKNVDGPLDDTEPTQRPLTVDDLLTFRMGHGLITEPEFQPRWPIVMAGEELDLTLAQPDPRTPHGLDEWMRRFGTLPLMQQPGRQWQYNTGTLLAGALIARASGMAFEDFLRQRIFAPLGMTETGFSVPASEISRMPTYYITGTEAGPNSDWTTRPAFPSGSGGLASTVDDYAKFARMMLNNGAHNGLQLLSERSVAVMTANQLTDEQVASAGMLLAPRGWGYGLSVVDGRYGWEGGSGTVWFNDPSRELIAIALTQTSDFLFAGGAPEFTELVLATH